MDGWMDGRVDEWMVEALGSVATWKRCNTITDNTWAFKEIRNELNECRNWAVWFSSKLMADRWAIESDWVDKWMQVRCKRARRATMTNCQLKTSWNELKRAETSWNELKRRCIHSIPLVLLICISINQTLAPSKRLRVYFVDQFPIIFDGFRFISMIQSDGAVSAPSHHDHIGTFLVSPPFTFLFIYLFCVVFFLCSVFLQLSYSAQTNDALSCHIINFRCNEINQSVIMTHALQSRE